MKSGDRLGSVIKKDAEYLLSVKVSRQTIAEFLEAASESNVLFNTTIIGHNPAEDPGAPLSVRGNQYCGFQDDPFNPTFGNPAARNASADLVILPLQIKFPGLITTLIRRLCFFESSSYRVDPAAIVALLPRKAEFIPRKVAKPALGGASELLDLVS